MAVLDRTAGALGTDNLTVQIGVDIDRPTLDARKGKAGVTAAVGGLAVTPL